MSDLTNQVENIESLIPTEEKTKRKITLFEEKRTIDSQNREFWYIVKGIAILAVVLGHCVNFAESIMGLFHLQLFFFV